MAHTNDSIFILIEEEEIEAIENLINSGKVDVNDVDEVSAKFESRDDIYAEIHLLTICKFQV